MRDEYLFAARKSIEKRIFTLLRHNGDAESEFCAYGAPPFFLFACARGDMQYAMVLCARHEAVRACAARYASAIVLCGAALESVNAAVKKAWRAARHIVDAHYLHICV